MQWTTDEDLTEAIRSIGITDVLEIKFFENRANGQSKGWGLHCLCATWVDKIPASSLKCSVAALQILRMLSWHHARSGNFMHVCPKLMMGTGMTFAFVHNHTGLRLFVWARRHRPGNWWSCCQRGSSTVRIPSSRRATNSPSASSRCSRAKVSRASANVWHAS